MSSYAVNQQYEASEIRPVKRKWTNSPPFWRKESLIGTQTNSNVFSVFRVWLHRPCYDFPGWASYIGLVNSHSAFAKISLDDITTIIELLTELREQVIQHQAQFNSEAELIIQQKELRENVARTFERGIDPTTGEICNEGQPMGNWNPELIMHLMEKYNSRPIQSNQVPNNNPVDGNSQANSPAPESKDKKGVKRKCLESNKAEQSEA